MLCGYSLLINTWTKLKKSSKESTSICVYDHTISSEGLLEKKGMSKWGNISWELCVLKYIKQ